MKKTVCIILALLMLTLASVSCGNAGGSDGENTSGNDSTAETSAAPEPEYEISVADLSKYAVVRHEEITEDERNALIKLNNQIEKIYGSKLTAKDDFFREGIPALAIGEYEILLGDTDREESQIFLKDLKRDDYGYRIVGKKLVIAGRTPEGTVKAIDNFIVNNLLKKADTVFFSNENEFISRADYPLEALTLNGVPANEYTIVYPSGNRNSEKLVAEKIRDGIADACGSYLKISNDNKAYDGGYELSVGKTSHLPASLAASLPSSPEADKFYMSGDEKIIAFYAADPAGFLSAATEFVKAIKSGADASGNSAYELKESFSASVTGTKLSVMTFNVWVSSVTDARSERVIQMVKNYMPDTVGFQEASPDWMKRLKNGLGELYACVGQGRDGGNSGEYNPIFYLKDKFTLKDSGTEWLSDTPTVVSKVPESSLNRIYTYAVLENKADGTVFVHVNTHLEHTSADARDKQMAVLLKRIKPLFKYPVVMTGDFNSQSDTKVYKSVTSGGFADTASVAKEKYVTRTFRGSNDTSQSVIDFIFVTPLYIAADRYKVCDEKINGDYTSDHNPVFAAYTVIQ